MEGAGILLWWRKTWISPDCMECSETHDCVTGEITEESHPYIPFVFREAFGEEDATK